MRDVARLLGDMLATGVIRDYAVFGAVAQMRCIEAIVTFDADILLAVGSETGRDMLRPLNRFCESRGWPA